MSLLLASTHAFASMEQKGIRWGGPLPIRTPQNPKQNLCTSSSLGATLEEPLSSSSSLNGATDPKDDAIGGHHVKTSDVLSLDSIRSTLIRQEETIIFAIIERAQYRQNSIVYEKGGFPDLVLSNIGKEDMEQDPISFLEYMMIGTVSCCLFQKVKMDSLVNTVHRWTRVLTYSIVLTRELQLSFLGKSSLWSSPLHVSGRTCLFPRLFTLGTTRSPPFPRISR